MDDEVFDEAMKAAVTILPPDGYALVKLPAPDSLRYDGDEHEPTDRDSWIVNEFEASYWPQHPGEIQFGRDGYNEPVSVADARALAAALLAAAERAKL